MSSLFRRLIQRFKRSKDYPTGDQSTPDPRSSSQPSFHPQIGRRPTSDPRSGGRSTPNLLSIDQRIKNPSSGGQNIIKPSFDQVDQPYGPDFSGQSTPDPSSSVHSTLSHQPTPASRSGGQFTPNRRSIDKRISNPSSSGHNIIEPSFNQGDQPSAPNFSGQSTYDPRSSSQPTFHAQLGHRPSSDSRSGGHSTSNRRSIDKRINNPSSSGQNIEPSFDQGDQPTAPNFSGQSTYDQRSNSQLSFNPQFGHRPSSDSRSGGQSTPNLLSVDKSITDRYSGGQYTSRPSFDQGDHPTAGDSTGQSTPDPRSSGQPINNGIYVITNPLHNRCVCLEDPNDTTPLRAHYNPEGSSARWRIKSWGKDEYSIQNVDHNRYAYCGVGAGVEASVEGYSKEQLWRIQAHTRGEGECTIATSDNRYLWMLPDAEPGTPIELFNVRNDRKCWWTFKRQEIGDPANDGQSMPDPHRGSQRTPDVIEFLDITSVITEATDLLQPLRAACGAIRVVVQRAENIGHVNEDRKALMNVLRIHLATVENHIAKLEEDQKIDGITPNLNREIGELLETYSRELKEIYEQFFDNQSNQSSLVNRVTAKDHNKGTIAKKARKIDEIFRGYTVALHRFAASTVDQMRQQLTQFGREAVKVRRTTDGAPPSRINQPNAYGVQHGECLQGTREKTLAAIRSWVDDERTKTGIFFFLDVAGSGKSTVAKNMAEEWKRDKRLLARFFFSRDTTETMSTSTFCSTVAGAFADLDPNFKVHMDKFMKRPNARLLSFKEKFEGLVVGPLRAIGRHAILIIDALDECNPEQRDELLGTLDALHGSIPLLRILATGRPERDIKRWAEEKFRFGYTNFTQLEGSDKDVEQYINHRLQDLPIVQDRLYPVIRHAEGLFIWARVACDLLVDSDDVDSLLEDLGKEVSLDSLYKVALKQSMPKDVASRRAVVLVLQMILAAREPLSIAELEILSPKPGAVEKVVSRLGSVLLYQDREDPIRLLHATFREFLTIQSKADVFFIQPELGHHTLAAGCLNAISHVSKQDKSSLRKLGRISDRKIISFLDKILIDCVSRTFVYSSRSWVHHCSMAYRKLALNDQILEFSNRRLTTWIDLADNWRRLDAENCLGTVLLLSRENMSPQVTEVLVSQSLELVRLHTYDLLSVPMPLHYRDS